MVNFPKKRFLRRIESLNKTIYKAKDEIYLLSKQYAEAASKFSVGDKVVLVKLKNSITYEIISIRYCFESDQILYVCNPISHTGKLIKEFKEEELIKTSYYKYEKAKHVRKRLDYGVVAEFIEHNPTLYNDIITEHFGIGLSTLYKIKRMYGLTKK